MNVEELMEVLIRINKERKSPVDEEILKQVIALVVRNPLDEDRGQCQEQIGLVISQGAEGRRK